MSRTLTNQETAELAKKLRSCAGKSIAETQAALTEIAAAGLAWDNNPEVSRAALDLAEALLSKADTLNLCTLAGQSKLAGIREGESANLLTALMLHAPGFQMDDEQKSCFKSLIKHMGDIQQPSYGFGGLFPIHAAAIANNPGYLSSLLEMGAKPDALDTEQRSAIWHLFNTPDGGAIQANKELCVEILAAHGADLRVGDKGPRRPLCLACSMLRADLAERLLEAGCDPSPKGSSLDPAENPNDPLACAAAAKISAEESYLNNQAKKLGLNPEAAADLVASEDLDSNASFAKIVQSLQTRGYDTAGALQGANLKGKYKPPFNPQQAKPVVKKRL